MLGFDELLKKERDGWIVIAHMSKFGSEVYSDLFHSW